VRHVARPSHRAWKPVHVTLRASRKSPPLRSELAARAVKEAIRATRLEGFRVVHYSIQQDHLHALVEADGHGELTRGMRSLAIRIAKRVNRVLGRGRGKSGKIWGDRYHRQDLTTPRQVRNAIVYVLANYKKHFGITHGAPRIDPCSSARWFEGWVTERARPREASPVASAETHLLASLWKRHGLVHPGERPAAVAR
jgi:REP element-mobilizing transposase RayT